MADQTQSKMNEYLKKIKGRGVKLNAAGEIENPTAKDVKDFNREFTTTPAKKTNIVKRVVKKVTDRYMATKSLDDLTSKVQKVLHPKYPSKDNWDAIRYRLKKGTFDPKSVRMRDE